MAALRRPDRTQEQHHRVKEGGQCGQEELVAQPEVAEVREVVVQQVELSWVRTVAPGSPTK